MILRPSDVDINIISLLREVCLILVNKQPGAQFFMYVYFYSLHVSGSRVPSIGRIIVSMRCAVWYAGAYAPAYQTVIYTE